MKIKKWAYFITGGITVMVISMPLLLYIPGAKNLVIMFLGALKTTDYKNAYIGILGSVIGSWLAVTGALYTQRKMDEEKERQESVRRTNNIRIVCREVLWNDIISNHRQLTCHDKEHLHHIISEISGYTVSQSFSYRLQNWMDLRNRVIFENIDDSENIVHIMQLYKYYEFMANYAGDLGDVCKKSKLDFSQYEDVYDKVVKYLGIK